MRLRPSALVSRIICEKNQRATCSRTAHSGRQLGSYSLTFRICPPGQRLSAPLVPLERFAIRLKKRRIANQAIRIEPATLALPVQCLCDSTGRKLVHGSVQTEDSATHSGREEAVGRVGQFTALSKS